MSRTPKFYDGTAPTGKRADRILSHILSEIGNQTGHQGHEVIEAWAEIIGPKFASLTEAVSMQDGLLTVKVKSSTLYSLLCQHEKPRLLVRLRGKFPRASIRDIVFRMGG